MSIWPRLIVCLPLLVLCACASDGGEEEPDNEVCGFWGYCPPKDSILCDFGGLCDDEEGEEKSEEGGDAKKKSTGGGGADTTSHDGSVPHDSGTSHSD